MSPEDSSVPSAADAFSLLGDETRLEIVLTLDDALNVIETVER